MGIKGLTHILLLAGVLSASTGFAAQIHGRSSTQLIWFNDFYTGRQVELVEYLFPQTASASPLPNSVPTAITRTISPPAPRGSRDTIPATPLPP